RARTRRFTASRSRCSTTSRCGAERRCNRWRSPTEEGRERSINPDYRDARARACTRRPAPAEPHQHDRTTSEIAAGIATAAGVGRLARIVDALRTAVGVQQAARAEYVADDELGIAVGSRVHTRRHRRARDPRVDADLEYLAFDRRERRSTRVARGEADVV